MYIKCSLESEVNNLSPRTGRPKVKDPIKHQITVRLTEAAMKKLEIYCKTYGITKGEAVRKGVEKLLDEK